MSSCFVHGFFLSLGLIVAIGAQNAFVLSNGLRKNRVLLIALLCSLGDALLISIGVFGTGTLLATNPLIGAVALWGGVAFLIVYGLQALRSACRKGTLTPHDSTTGSTLTIGLATLAVTLLNPHAYLDTIVLLGAISNRFAGMDRVLFAAGAVTASFTWFFSLAYGSRMLMPLFASPRSWQILDTLVGLTMLSLAGSLLLKG